MRSSEFNSVINSIEDGFLETDLKGAVVFFNPAFCTIVGYSPDESYGLSYRDYMEEETAVKVYKTFNKVYSTKVSNKSFDYQIIRKDGEKRNVEISITPIESESGIVMGFRCIMRDVTRRKQAEEEVERQRRRLRAIFRSVEDGIITVDRELVVTEANDAALRICGHASEETQKNMFCSRNSSCSLSCKQILEETLATRKTVRESRVKCCHTKSPLQKVSLTCTPLEDSDGRFMGAVLVIKDVTRISDLERELKKRSQFHEIIGQSHEMQKIYGLIEDISDYDATVLVSGESGTGKELVARAIHYSGSRRFKPFVTVNCSALAETLLESELFGHVKGAFTGAVRDHIGRFESAHNGTILLDEIGDISPLIQLKLLRVLQEKSIEKVGDSKSIKVDVRVIACTHQNLKEKVRKGEFREDLYYRLKVLEINIPPLRERLDDLKLLITHFVSKFEKLFNLSVGNFTDEVYEALISYNWPGNIRELEHCIERAVILCRGKDITCDHIPEDIYVKTEKAELKQISSGKDEPELILNVLKETGWNKSKAAIRLNISRKTLYQKIKKYSIPLKEK
ncbi:MAG: sigma 54-interacting transcriptional regulator [Desulfobacteraceae bacterium]